ncbi:hypothetical protein BX616_002352 [Lobosporangium transversale]|nr:hypothetical protein BX616_002352 [Lobosporangium transversale]
MDSNEKNVKIAEYPTATGYDLGGSKEPLSPLKEDSNQEDNNEYNQNLFQQGNTKQHGGKGLTGRSPSSSKDNLPSRSMSVYHGLSASLFEHAPKFGQDNGSAPVAIQTFHDNKRCYNLEQNTTKPNSTSANTSRSVTSIPSHTEHIKLKNASAVTGTSKNQSHAAPQNTPSASFELSSSEALKTKLSGPALSSEKKNQNGQTAGTAAVTTTSCPAVAPQGGKLSQEGSDNVNSPDLHRGKKHLDEEKNNEQHSADLHHTKAEKHFMSKGSYNHDSRDGNSNMPSSTTHDHSRAATQSHETHPQSQHSERDFSEGSMAAQSGLEKQQGFEDTYADASPSIDVKRGKERYYDHSEDKEVQDGHRHYYEYSGKDLDAPIDDVHPPKAITQPQARPEIEPSARNNDRERRPYELKGEDLTDPVNIEELSNPEQFNEAEYHDAERHPLRRSRSQQHRQPSNTRGVGRYKSDSHLLAHEAIQGQSQKCNEQQAFSTTSEDGSNSMTRPDPATPTSTKPRQMSLTSPSRSSKGDGHHYSDIDTIRGPYSEQTAHSKSDPAHYKGDRRNLDIETIYRPHHSEQQPPSERDSTHFNGDGHHLDFEAIYDSYSNPDKADREVEQPSNYNESGNHRNLENQPLCESYHGSSSDQGTLPRTHSPVVAPQPSLPPKTAEVPAGADSQKKSKVTKRATWNGTEVPSKEAKKPNAPNPLSFGFGYKDYKKAAVLNANKKVDSTTLAAANVPLPSSPSSSRATDSVNWGAAGATLPSSPSDRSGSISTQSHKPADIQSSSSYYSSAADKQQSHPSWAPEMRSFSPSQDRPIHIQETYHAPDTNQGHLHQHHHNHHNPIHSRNHSQSSHMRESNSFRSISDTNRNISVGSRPQGGHYLTQPNSFSLRKVSVSKILGRIPANMSRSHVPPSKTSKGSFPAKGPIFEKAAPVATPQAISHDYAQPTIATPTPVHPRDASLSTSALGTTTGEVTPNTAGTDATIASDSVKNVEESKYILDRSNNKVYTGDHHTPNGAALRQTKEDLTLCPEEQGSYPRADSLDEHVNPVRPHLDDNQPIVGVEEEIQLNESEMHAHHDAHPSTIEKIKDVLGSLVPQSDENKTHTYHDAHSDTLYPEEQSSYPRADNMSDIPNPARPHLADNQPIVGAQGEVELDESKMHAHHDAHPSTIEKIKSVLSSLIPQSDESKSHTHHDAPLSTLYREKQHSYSLEDSLDVAADFTRSRLDDYQPIVGVEEGAQSDENKIHAHHDVHADTLYPEEQSSYPRMDNVNERSNPPRPHLDDRQPIIGAEREIQLDESEMHARHDAYPSTIGKIKDVLTSLVPQLDESKIHAQHDAHLSTLYRENNLGEQMDPAHLHINDHQLIVGAGDVQSDKDKMCTHHDTYSGTLYPEERSSYPRTDTLERHANPARPHLDDNQPIVGAEGEVQLDETEMHAHHDAHPSTIEKIKGVFSGLIPQLNESKTHVYHDAPLGTLYREKQDSYPMEDNLDDIVSPFRPHLDDHQPIVEAEEAWLDEDKMHAHHSAHSCTLYPEEQSSYPRADTLDRQANAVRPHLDDNQPIVGAEEEIQLDESEMHAHHDAHPTTLGKIKGALSSLIPQSDENKAHAYHGSHPSTLYPEEQGSYSRVENVDERTNPAHPHLDDNQPIVGVEEEIQLNESEMHAHHDAHPSTIEKIKDVLGSLVPQSDENKTHTYHDAHSDTLYPEEQTDNMSDIPNPARPHLDDDQPIIGAEEEIQLNEADMHAYHDAHPSTIGKIKGVLSNLVPMFGSQKDNDGETKAMDKGEEERSELRLKEEAAPTTATDFSESDMHLNGAAGVVEVAAALRAATTEEEQKAARKEEEVYSISANKLEPVLKAPTNDTMTTVLMMNKANSSHPSDNSIQNTVVPPIDDVDDEALIRRPKAKLKTAEYASTEGSDKRHHQPIPSTAAALSAATAAIAAGAATTAARAKDASSYQNMDETSITEHHDGNDNDDDQIITLVTISDNDASSTSKQEDIDRPITSSMSDKSYDNDLSPTLHPREMDVAEKKAYDGGASEAMAVSQLLDGDDEAVATTTQGDGAVIATTIDDEAAITTTEDKEVTAKDGTVDGDHTVKRENDDDNHKDDGYATTTKRTKKTKNYLKNLNLSARVSNIATPAAAAVNDAAVLYKQRQPTRQKPELTVKEKDVEKPMVPKVSHRLTLTEDDVEKPTVPHVVYLLTLTEDDVEKPVVPQVSYVLTLTEDDVEKPVPFLSAPPTLSLTEEDVEKPDPTKEHYRHPVIPAVPSKPVSTSAMKVARAPQPMIPPVPQRGKDRLPPMPEIHMPKVNIAMPKMNIPKMQRHTGEKKNRKMKFPQISMSKMPAVHMPTIIKKSKVSPQTAMTGKSKGKAKVTTESLVISEPIMVVELDKAPLPVTEPSLPPKTEVHIEELAEIHPAEDDTPSEDVLKSITVSVPPSPLLVALAVGAPKPANEAIVLSEFPVPVHAPIAKRPVIVDVTTIAATVPDIIVRTETPSPSIPVVESQIPLPPSPPPAPPALAANPPTPPPLPPVLATNPPPPPPPPPILATNPPTPPPLPPVLAANPPTPPPLPPVLATKPPTPPPPPPILATNPPTPPPFPPVLAAKPPTPPPPPPASAVKLPTPSPAPSTAAVSPIPAPASTPSPVTAPPTVTTNSSFQPNDDVPGVDRPSSLVLTKKIQTTHYYYDSEKQEEEDLDEFGYRKDRDVSRYIDPEVLSRKGSKGSSRDKNRGSRYSADVGRTDYHNQNHTQPHGFHGQTTQLQNDYQYQASQQPNQLHRLHQYPVDTKRRSIAFVGNDGGYNTQPRTEDGQQHQQSYQIDVGSHKPNIGYDRGYNTQPHKESQQAYRQQEHQQQYQQDGMIVGNNGGYNPQPRKGRF